MIQLRERYAIAAEVVGVVLLGATLVLAIGVIYAIALILAMVLIVLAQIINRR